MTVRKLDSLLDQGEYSTARKLLRQRLKEAPGDHWLMAKMASTFASEGRHRDGLRWVRRALRLEPKCPIALWHLAYIYEGRRHYVGAVRVMKGLVSRPIRAYVASGPCAQSERWARDFVTDCYMMLAWVEQCRHRHNQAADAYRKHMSRRLKGSRSSMGFPLRAVRASLAEQERLARKQRRRGASRP